MGAVFAFSQSLAESKKAPSKYGYAFLLKIPESIDHLKSIHLNSHIQILNNHGQLEDYAI